MAIPQDANQRWSLDFVSDTLTDGRCFRILCVIDDFSRECLATIVDTSISGERVAQELDIIAEHRGYRWMVEGDQAAARDGDPVGVALQVGEQCLRPSKWRLGVDYPSLPPDGPAP